MTRMNAWHPKGFFWGLYLTICLGLVLFFNAPVWASLRLELTQGVSRQIPIAITANGTSGTQPFASQIVAADCLKRVVEADLTDCGYFRSIKPDHKSVGGQNSQVWRYPGADYLIQISVHPGDRGYYQVTFSLANLIQSFPRVLMRESFSVPDHQLRGLAHHMSDKIFYHVLGIRGAFSTFVTYVLFDTQLKRYSLRLADADGFDRGSLIQSPQPIMSPSWSPDGRKIAYVSFEHIVPRVYIQEVVTGKRQLVTDFPGINGAPSWSPDGKKLALALSKNTANPKIYVVNLTNKQIHQITFGNSIDTEPSWSPDGQSLLFTSDRGGGLQIYELKLTTGKMRQLTFKGNYNAHAVYLPLGHGIILLHRDQQGRYVIARQDLRTGYLMILSRSVYGVSPSLSPNGQMIVYESKENTVSTLEVVSIDGRVSRQLATPKGSARSPCWSPFRF